MKFLILLTTFVLACQLVKGNGHSPAAEVYCNNDHTVDIVISNVDDADEWMPDEWELQNDPNCQPAINDAQQTVTYSDLILPDCAYDSIQGDDYIKYILKIEAKKDDPGAPGQLRAYDHLYYITCLYDNQNRSMTSFVPIVNRNDNDTDNAFFTFSLQAYLYENHTGVVPNLIKLDEYLYFKATVDTQSSNPNLDLFIVRCFSSSSGNPDDANVNVFDLIVNGCGNDTVSQDLNDTLMHNCTDDSIKETFKLRTYRYFGFGDGSKVYIHCELRVCLANEPNTLCECPSVAECDPANRKRRSIEDVVDESQVYRVTSGPFIFESDDEEQEQVNEEEGDADEQEESQSFSTNLVVIVVVSGVVAIAVCATIFFVLRSRSRRQQHGDLSIPT